MHQRGQKGLHRFGQRVFAATKVVNEPQRSQAIEPAVKGIEMGIPVPVLAA
jgi:hypothetical protein